MSALSGFLATGLFIDLFAGGGGASTGAELAGQKVDIAVNHSPTAIAIHKANHPTTEHLCQDIRAVWPKAATKLQPVAGAWFSPDCKEYSKAKGGPVKNRHIRALSNEVTHWLKEVRPTVGYLENVEEYEYAAPLDERGVPIPELRGKEFKSLVRQWRALGYRVQWRTLKACDYGTPTSRRRLYIIMRCDGLPIVWPKPTHGDPKSAAVTSGKLLPYRTAAECIDWSIRCPSIFDRTRPLAEATMRRIAHGVMRYVVNATNPYLVDGAFAAHITKFHGTGVGSPIVNPVPTVTANGNPARPAGATPLGLVGATLAPFVTYGQHGGANRPVAVPHHTIAASKKDQNAVAVAQLEPVQDNSEQAAAFLTSFYGSDKVNGGGEPEQPLRTARAGGTHHGVIAACMAQFNTNPNGTVNEGHDVRDLVSTIATRDPHQGVIETTMVEEGALPPEMMERATLVAAFLVKYYGEGGQHQALNRPIDVVTTRARYAVVTVTIDAVTYVIVDIGLRMLKPRELARAQGFPEGYVLDPIVRKYLRGKWVERPLTIAEQISAIGNSVCPPMAHALIAANQPRVPEMRLAA